MIRYLILFSGRSAYASQISGGIQVHAPPPQVKGLSLMRITRNTRDRSSRGLP